MDEQPARGDAGKAATPSEASSSPVVASTLFTQIDPYSWVRLECVNSVEIRRVPTYPQQDVVIDSYIVEVGVLSRTIAFKFEDLTEANKYVANLLRLIEEKVKLDGGQTPR